MDHLRRSASRHRTPPAGKQPTPLLTPPAGKQPTPLLTRCNSEHPVTSPPLTTISSNKSKTFTKLRSISTGRTRSYKELEVNIMTPMTINTNVTNLAAKKKPTHDVGTKVLQRRKPNSPSAWALSPGRVAPCPSPLPVKPPSPGGKTTSGGIGGVLKYFRQKKAVSLEDANVQNFKSMNNRLLQWRFANAQAESTMSAVKVTGEKKLFNSWLMILATRNSNMVKRIEVQKLKNHIRLYHIMNSQMFLLQKWSTMEAKNFEAVSRVVRKLTVASVNIPLLDDSKGDVLAVCDVLNCAITLMSDIETTITRLAYEAEKSCYLLTELSIIAKQEHESLAELRTWTTDVALLKEEERSLRAHLLQTK